MTTNANPKKTIPCKHESNITYLQLIQVNGDPYYTVKCENCGEYGTIKLEETENIFGMSENEIKDFTDGALS